MACLRTLLKCSWFANKLKYLKLLASHFRLRSLIKDVKGDAYDYFHNEHEEAGLEHIIDQLYKCEKPMKRWIKRGYDQMTLTTTV